MHHEPGRSIYLVSPRKWGEVFVVVARSSENAIDIINSLYPDKKYTLGTTNTRCVQRNVVAGSGVLARYDIFGANHRKTDDSTPIQMELV